ncbi:MAG: DEAD/DEAH box helicase family protein [Polyangiaceae bacterium]|nr:DEAD/DEAH box helicase family protein [Polyangiaceae bacterium]
MTSQDEWCLSFDRGTLILERGKTSADANTASLGAASPDTTGRVPPKVPPAWVPADFLYDDRIDAFRAPGVAYASTILAAKQERISIRDTARAYKELSLTVMARKEPRPYQVEALQAWEKAKRRGVVVLPTGAGKTHLATMVIEKAQRSTLIVAPTLELVRQWFEVLSSTFRVPVGIVGGGEHTVESLTVTTYDSAHIHMPRFGDKFGLVVFDECHHLPSPSYATAASACIAPFRLGLTATPERQDQREHDLAEWIGPLCYRKEIVELSGEFLSEYRTEKILVRLSDEERTEYQEERALYLAFVKSHAIAMGDPDGFSRFILLSSRSDEGRRAMNAYRRQREIAFANQTKLDVVEQLLSEHAQDRCILFTQDNDTAYKLARRFLIPALTHRTHVRERSEILAKFREGTYGAIATSKVLNEGVDVPEARVAIILSGSGSVREHVQRLGRILRKQADKQAILYELVSSDTTEANVSERRREHSAYRRTR